MLYVFLSIFYGLGYAMNLFTLIIMLIFTFETKKAIIAFGGVSTTPTIEMIYRYYGYIIGIMDHGSHRHVHKHCSNYPGKQRLPPNTTLEIRTQMTD